jgi:hypothetical protein
MSKLEINDLFNAINDNNQQTAEKESSTKPQPKSTKAT